MNFHLEYSVQKNRTTFTEVPLLPEIFCWNDPKSQLPLAFQLEMVNNLVNRTKKNHFVNGKQPWSPRYTVKKICVSKSVGLACSGKEIYHICFVLLGIWGKIPSTSPPGGLYLEGRFNQGFLICVTILGGLYFGGAYFCNFTVYPVS